MTKEQLIEMAIDRCRYEYGHLPKRGWEFVIKCTTRQRRIVIQYLGRDDQGFYLKEYSFKLKRRSNYIN